MEVVLAGHNLDRDLIAALAAASTLDPGALTPETLSAAYARISRDPRPIPELRAEARRDVARARRSNEQIVFGFGHASVAEHAVFNFDVLDVSRLAIEALEASRLGSYTEKSQRYILLERDFIVPDELRGGPLEAPFRELLARQQAGYRQAYETLAARYARKHPDAWGSPRSRRELEGAAKEDARYFLGLATTGQLGATLNARALEATIRRLAADPLAEVRELARRLHQAVVSVAPSLVRYTDPTALRRDTLCALREIADALASSEEATPAISADVPRETPVTLIAVSPDGETRLVAALLHGCGGQSWERAYASAARMTEANRRRIVLESLRRLGSHESPLRAFELPDLTFELIVSASCFAQLKRHRVATLLTQPYEPGLGMTEPPIFEETGLTSAYAKMCEESSALHRQVNALSPAAAAYALTNGHRRRVLFKANARELYHFASLRLDRHAQWDIRILAERMIVLARERLPLTMMLAAGKDRFAQARQAAGLEGSEGGSSAPGADAPRG
jgi:flavin-dependent thymidylate synthase